ncbi:MAG: MFS transporter [Spirochaetia bacterium]|nr:MFS transporter [Spirochaetia bacterium]
MVGLKFNIFVFWGIHVTITQRHQVVSYYLSFFSFGLIISTLGIALPYLADHAGVSLGDAALMFTMNSLGFLFGSLITGYLYDVVRGKYLLSFAWILAAGSTYFLPILSSLTLMCAVNVVFGFANSTIVVGCNTLITRVDKEHTTSLLSAMHVVNGVGAFLTPILFTLVITKTNDVVSAYHIYSFFFLFLAIFVLFTPIHIKKEKKREKKEHVPIKNNNVLLIILLALIAFVYVGSEISFSGWIYTFMKVQFPTFEGNAGYVMAAFWVFMTLGRIFFTYLTKYCRVRVLMIYTLLGAIIGLSFIAIFDSNFVMVWIGTMLSGFFLGSVFPFIVSFGDNSIGMSGKVSGVVFGGTSFGGMLMPYMNGQLFERVSPASTMFSIMISITITLLIFIILYKKAPANEKEVTSIIGKTVYEPPLVTKVDN